MSMRFSAACTAVVAMLAAIVAATPAGAAPGALDPSFGEGGIVRMLPSEEDIGLRGVVAQPDGRIVLAGGQAPGSVLLARLTESGALDPSFGQGGIVTTSFPGGFGLASAVALQPDGKIVAAGSAKGAVDEDVLVARYNPDGSLDGSFGGGDGIAVVPVGAAADEGSAVALAADGRIVVVGTAEVPAPADEGVAVVVLLADGTPDPAFAGDGSTIVTTPVGNDSGEGVAVQPDGRIVVADAAGAGVGDGFVLLRLLPNGTLDGTFDGDGIAQTPIPAVGSAIGGGRSTAVGLLPDGRIVAAGYGYDEVGMPPTSDLKMAAARYLPDGQLDPSFATAGIFDRQVGVASDAARWLGITPAGKLLLAGEYMVSSPPHTIQSPALLRLDPDGVVDPTFGSGGFVLRGATAPFGEIFQGAALDSEERTVAVSTAFIGGGNTEVLVSRFLGDKLPALVAMRERPSRGAHARMKSIPRRVRADKLNSFSGTAVAGGAGLSKVQVALAKLVPGGARASAAAPRRKCLALKNARARFRSVKPTGRRQTRRCPQLWLNAKGAERWTYKLRRRLPPGRYVVYARAVDGSGVAETAFSRAAGNRYAFRVLPAR